MSFIVCIDLWSHALSISYKMLMFCIEKKSASLKSSHNTNGRAEGIIGANSESTIIELCLEGKRNNQSRLMHKFV